jgi:hypothetical protein
MTFSRFFVAIIGSQLGNFTDGFFCLHCGFNGEFHSSSPWSVCGWQEIVRNTLAVSLATEIFDFHHELVFCVTKLRTLTRIKSNADAKLEKWGRKSCNQLQIIRLWIFMVCGGVPWCDVIMICVVSD